MDWQLIVFVQVQLRSTMQLKFDLTQGIARSVFLIFEQTVQGLTVSFLFLHRQNADLQCFFCYFCTYKLHYFSVFAIFAQTTIIVSFLFLHRQHVH